MYRSFLFHRGLSLSLVLAGYACDHTAAAVLSLETFKPASQQALHLFARTRAMRSRFFDRLTTNHRCLT